MTFSFREIRRLNGSSYSNISQLQQYYSFSFMLYHAHNRVGRGNLELRHSVPHFQPNYEGIACWVAEVNAALHLDTRAKKWKYKFK